MSEYICELCPSKLTSEDMRVSFDYRQVREEIVRCRDCKHYTDDEMEYYHYCGEWCEQVEPDDFCSRGGRR